MSISERKCLGNPEKSESYLQSNTAGKFRAYRQFAESTKTKLREAETIVKELKSEINFSRKEEKNLRSQISSAQNRLICLQETLKKFINISDQQLQNEKISQRIQERLQEIEKNIDEIRQKSQGILHYATREIDLLKKIKEVESALEEKNSECDLMKMEIQTITKEKKNMETEFQEKLKNLESSLKSLEKQKSETQIHHSETLLYYKQQIEDYEQKIKRYEKERKSFLEDFEVPKPSEINSYKVAWAFSTVSINPEKRFSKTQNSKKRNKAQTESEDSDDKIFQCSLVAEKSKPVNFKKSKNFSRISKKQKPQLEFMTQDSSEKVNSDEKGRKRRLFSTNRNHYIL